jgi:hypothetical protein
MQAERRFRWVLAVLVGIAAGLMPGLAAAANLGAGTDSVGKTDGVGNVGWIGGAPTQMTRAGGPRIHLKTLIFAEPGRGSQEKSMYPGTRKVKATQLAFGVVVGADKQLSEVATADGGLKLRVSAIRLSTAWKGAQGRDVERWSEDYKGAGLLVGPEVGLRVGISGGFAVRPFASAGLAVNHLRYGFEYGLLEWGIGIEIIPGPGPWSAGIGRHYLNDGSGGITPGDLVGVTFLSVRYRFGT